jgi:zinc transporter ZupT
MLASPLGMLVGMLVDTSGPSMTLVVIQAMSGGVFVYLACCDLLIHQFHHAPFVSKTENLKKYVAMCMGSAIVITLIAIAPSHEH